MAVLLRRALLSLEASTLRIWSSIAGQQPALEFVPAELDHSSHGSTSIWDILRDAVLQAVPKKKISHSRKRMRSAHKGLKLMHNICVCPTCNKPRLLHHICWDCFQKGKNIVPVNS